MKTINHNLQDRIKKLLKIKKNRNLVDNEYQTLLYLIDTAIWTTKKTIADKRVAEIKSNRLYALKLIQDDVRILLDKNIKNQQVNKIFENLKSYGYIKDRDNNENEKDDNRNKKSFFAVDIHKLLSDLDYYDLLDKKDYIKIHNGKKGLIDIRCRDIIKTELLMNWHRKQKLKRQ
jgi:hypothetical protein